MSGLLNVRGPIGSGKPVVITRIIDEITYMLALKSGGSYLYLSFDTAKEIDNIPLILNNQYLGVRQDFMAFTLIVPKSGTLNLTYAGRFSNNADIIPYLNLSLVTLTLVPTTKNYLFDPIYNNLYVDQVYASIDYAIASNFSVRFLPANKNDYYMWTGASVVRGNDLYPNKNIISFFTRTEPYNIGGIVGNFEYPKGKCETLEPGKLTYADSGCLFTTSKEAVRQYWYNYCSKNATCGVECFGKCGNLNNDCNFITKLGGRGEYSCYVVEPPPFSSGQSNVLPTWIIIYIICLIAFLIFIIIVWVFRNVYRSRIVT